MRGQWRGEYDTSLSAGSWRVSPSGVCVFVCVCVCVCVCLYVCVFAWGIISEVYTVQNLLE